MSTVPMRSPNDDGTMRGLRYWNSKPSSEIDAYLDRTDGTTNDMEIHCRELAFTVLESRSLTAAGSVRTKPYGT